MYEWDEAKRQVNFAKHGVDFADLERFIWQPGRIREDKRIQYGEQRFIVDGHIAGRQFVLVFAKRNLKIRVISLRKANPREQRNYEQSQKLY